jgi:hypothetical protein
VEGRRDRPKQTFGGSDVFHSVPFTGVVRYPENTTGVVLLRLNAWHTNDKRGAL